MEQNPYKKLTVVVADDSRAMREMLAAILESEGVPTVLQAEDGEGVMRLLTAPDAPAVDLIFCDLAMPGIDGVETMRRIAASPLQPAIALISGHDPKILQSVSNMTTELGLHVVGTVSKPFKPESIVALLKESLMARRIYRARQTFATSVADLDDALAQNRVELYYQPKVRLSDAKLMGVEALVRIQHPALGLLEPDQFISVAESRGRIVQLTTIVLEKAIAQAGAWYREGLDLSVAINLSTLALARLDLPEVIGGMAEAAGVPTDRLIIEVTESQVGESAEILHILSRLRLRGFHLSIDDYGTGQSGLQRLKRLPFNELKIDKSFVTGAHRDPDLRSILEVSIDLGQRLRMDVVAEGVESWQDWQLLKQLGCDMAQGYAIAKPMPAGGVALWANTWQAPI